MSNWSKNHAKVVQMNRDHPGVLFADNFTSDLSDDEFAKWTGAIVPKDELAAGRTRGLDDQVDDDKDGRQLG